MDYAVVEEGRQGIVTLCESLEARIADLGDALGQLDSTWTGAASEAYHQAYAQWVSAAREVRENLAFVHQMVCTAQVNFAAADTAAVATWQGDQ
jgi:early secretory antigenic target protein ESAT-6